MILCDSLLALKNISIIEQGMVFRIRGKAQYFQGLFSKAGKDFTESVRLLEKETPLSELGLTLIEQAKLYRKLKMYPQAIETYERAYSVFEKLNDKNQLATVLNEWGVVYELMADYPKSIDFYKRSLTIKEQEKDTLGIAYASSFLANVYALQKDNAQAIHYFQESALLFKQINQPYELAMLNSDMASFYLSIKNYDKAIHSLEFSDSIARVMGKPDLLSQNYLTLSTVFSEMHDYKKAYDFHQKFSSLKDSLFSVASQRAIAELNVQYKAAEKDKQILEQTSHIERQRWYLSLAALLLVAAAAFFGILYKNKKNREAQIIREARQKEELLRLEAGNEMYRERLRISRDLHDNIGSYLTFINMAIQQLDQQEEEINKLKEVTGETLSELKRTVWLINKPSVTLEEWTFKLKEYYSKLNLVEIETNYSHPHTALSALQATSLFRMIQETVNNALKYAKPEKIKVTLLQKSNSLHTYITDDGTGFDMQTVKKGYGLDNISNRAKELNGESMIESSLHGGTKVTILLPLKNT